MRPERAAAPGHTVAEMIEIGKTYEFEPGHDAPTGRALKGRKALVIEHRREDFYGIRWPNGSTDILLESELKGPVEAAKPGVDEACLLCAGTRWVSIYEPDPDEEWVSHLVGAAPCPNCWAPA